MAMEDATKYAAGGLPPGRGAEWIHHYLRGRAPRDLPAVAEEHMGNAVGPPTEAIKVYINHGRWVAECPDCHSAQLACRTDHRFLCNECGNVAVGNRWRRVVWPSEPDAIEQALARRPSRANQNWEPWQTVEDLLAEEIVHGGGD